MDKIQKLQENIVPASNQNSKNVFFHGKGDFRLMFVGNSITKHQPKPEIGWTADCGMAATSAEKDYVHILVKKTEEVLGEEISWCIVGAGEFELNLPTCSIEGLYKAAESYNPDILIMFFGANVSKDYDSDPNPQVKFGDKYEELRNYLAGDKTKVFHSQGYYIRPVLDKEKQQVAQKYGDEFLNIEDIRTSEETHGIYNHPNDLGMRLIAERFWDKIKAEI